MQGLTFLCSSLSFMLNMRYVLVSAFCLFACSTGFALETNLETGTVIETNDPKTNYGYGFGTFCGTQITKDNLHELANEHLSSQEWRKSAIELTHQWLFTQHTVGCMSNFESVDDIMVPPCEVSGDQFKKLKEKEERTYFVLKHNGAKILSTGANLVVHIAAQQENDPSVVLRVPSGINKLISLMASKVYDPYYPRKTPMSYADVESYTPTYQGLSLLAYGLRFKQQGFRNIHTPDMCPLHMPEASEEFCDANYAVVQQYEQGLVPLWNMPVEKRSEIIRALPERAIEELYKMVRFGPCYSPKLCIHPQNPTQLVMTNPEQPNHCSPQNFFYQTDPATFTYPHDVGDPRVENAPGKCMSNKYQHHVTADGLPRAHQWYIHYATEDQQELWDRLSKKYAF